MRSDVNEMIQMRRSAFISAAGDAADHSNSHVHKFIQSLILSLAGSWRTWASSNWPERVCSVLGVNMGLISHPWTERYRCSHQNNWQWIACFTHNVRKLVTFGHISRCTQFFSGSLSCGYTQYICHCKMHLLQSASVHFIPVSENALPKHFCGHNPVISIWIQ